MVKPTLVLGALFVDNFSYLHDNRCTVKQSDDIWSQAEAP